MTGVHGRQRELEVLRVLLYEHRDRCRTQLRLLNQPPADGGGGTEQPVLAALTRRRLRDLEHALDAIDRGHYGVCTACTADIRIDHLLLQPAASRCPGCADADLRHRV